MSLPRIKLLPPALCNQIAAGEVVERPASVVKELVENSLDALSTSIEVSLENGGQGLVRVQDNGMGMVRGDLELALTRHATSKIRAVDDLENINSYGFRGEALPSVASVSRCSLTSIAQGEEEAWTMRVEFGRTVGVEPASLHRGTVVEVRDLFLNVPARLKFLRGMPTEVKHCQEWLTRLGLARPDVAFRLESEGRELVDFRRGESVFERLEKIWPSLVTENLLPFEKVIYGMRVHGYTSRPGVSQPRANRILLFVNGRNVADKKILAAIREAYRGRITSRDHPQVLLFLEMDPQEVDVNVHPAKSEVRFRNENAVFKAVLVALRETLDRAGTGNAPMTDEEVRPLRASDSGTAPGASAGLSAGAAAGGAGGDPAPVSRMPEGTPSERMPGAVDAPWASPEHRPRGFWGRVDDAGRPDLRRLKSGTQEDGEWSVSAGEDTFSGSASDSVSSWGCTGFGGPGFGPFDRGEAGADFSARYVPADAGVRAADGIGGGHTSGDSGESGCTGSADQSAPSATSVPLPVSEEEKGVGTEGANTGLPTVRGIAYLGQVAGTYLVLRDAAGALLLLDQHAAHERVFYSRMRRQGYRGQGQGLAVPLELPLHASEAERWMEIAERMANLGFGARVSGNTLVVTAVPVLLERSQARDFLREALAGRRDDLDARFASMSCKSAIKAGDELTVDEALHLLERWLDTEDREYCPHGRPVVLRWDAKELERLFKRRQS